MTVESRPVELIRVFLADANPTFLEAAARCLASAGNLVLVGRASTGAEALRQAADLRPELVLVDIGLRDMNGLEVARQIKAWSDPPRVVIVAFNEGAQYQEASRSAGADGFIAKVEFQAELYRLIHAWFPRTRESAVPACAPTGAVPNGNAA